MYDVFAVGSMTRDAFMEADFKTISWLRTPSGKAYLLPLGEKFEVKKIFFTIGGNSANASVTFARQGLRTACTARTGRDAHGEEIRRRLEKEKVETKFMTYDPSLATAYSVLLLEGFGSGRGERTILSYHGASNRFSFRDLRPAAMRAKWWYVSLAGESDRMFIDLLKEARILKVAVAFNPSGYHLSHRRQEILGHLKDLSFLVLNEEEASLLAGTSFRNGQRVLEKLIRLMPGGIVAVTNGRSGATVSDGKFVYKAGIFREKRLVDRTGAGDAFGSGFVSGLIHHKLRLRNIGTATPEDIKYAIRLAAANATSGVEKIGATEGILTKKGFQEKRWRKLKIEIKRLVS